MTAPSGKEGAAEAARVSAAAAAPAPNIESASRRVHFVARGSAFMSMAPFSSSATDAASKDSGIVGKLGAQFPERVKKLKALILRRPPPWAAVSKDGNRHCRASGHPSRRAAKKRRFSG